MTRILENFTPLLGRVSRTERLARRVLATPPHWLRAGRGAGGSPLDDLEEDLSWLMDQRCVQGLELGPVIRTARAALAHAGRRVLTVATVGVLVTGAVVGVDSTAGATERPWPSHQSAAVPAVGDGESGRR